MAGRRKAPGTIEQQPSGMWRAYYTHNRRRHTPGRTFRRRGSAEEWLAAERALIDQGQWTPPEQRRAEAEAAEIRDSTTLGTFARTWIDSRTTSRGTPLAPRTAAEYGAYLDGRLAVFATKPMAAITRAEVDEWWLANQDAPLLRHHVYAFLKSVMADAVDRELIASNPCKVRNAARRSTQRPKALQNDLIVGLGPLEVAALADATKPDQWRALVLLLAWSGLRPSEALALTRSDLVVAAEVDGAKRWTVKVTKALSRTTAGDVGPMPPKTTESIRFVPLPPHVADELATHLDQWAAPGPDGLVWPSTNPVRPFGSIKQVMGTHPGSKGQVSGFNAARVAIGRPELRLYDLRRWARHMWRKAGIGDADCEQLLGHKLDPVMGSYVTQDREELRPNMARLSELAGWSPPSTPQASAPAIDHRLLRVMTPEQLRAALGAMDDAELADAVAQLPAEVLARALSGR